MSTEDTDNRRLDEHLSGDSELSRLYREGAKEQPPTEVNERILESARKAAVRPRRSPLSPFAAHWTVPASVAAVVVLAASLVLLVQQEESDVPAPARAERDLQPDAANRQVLPEMPQAPRAAGEPPRRPVKEPSRAAGSDERARKRGGGRKDESRSGIVASESRKRDLRSAAPEPSAPRNPDVDESKERSGTVREEPREELDGASYRKPAAAGFSRSKRAPKAQFAPSQGDLATPLYRAPTPEIAESPETESGLPSEEDREPYGEPSMNVAPPPPMSPEKWLQHIRVLLDGNQDAAATRSLSEFRRHYPDYPLPQDLRKRGILN